jgi:hypothetical protein
VASSTCVKCGNTSFEIKEYQPANSKFLYNLLQCERCGGVVGIIEDRNVPELLIELARRLEVPYLFDVARGA